MVYSTRCNGLNTLLYFIKSTIPKNTPVIYNLYFTKSWNLYSGIPPRIPPGLHRLSTCTFNSLQYQLKTKQKRKNNIFILFSEKSKDRIIPSNLGHDPGVKPWPKFIIDLGSPKSFSIYRSKYKIIRESDCDNKKQKARG